MQADASGSYFGCIVGRCANRIDGASFRIPPRDGVGPPLGPYELEANDGRHALHGGSRHWGRRAWHGVETTLDEHIAVEFCLTSPDGDGGYPGAVDASVTYSLRELDGKAIEGDAGDSGGGAELRIVMRATASAPTPVNLVNHTHWNLAGRETLERVRCVPENTVGCAACSTAADTACLARARRAGWADCFCRLGFMLGPSSFEGSSLESCLA